ncbi:hypothetical protein OS493_038515, partial [Desmophyllum pertusum]
MIGMQSVYFASDPDVVSSAVCAVMGAFLHYFILAVFLWMSVIAHNTQKAFSTPNVDLHNPLVIAERNKSYIRHSLFSWGFPLLVVGICVTLQLTNTGNVGYGNAAAAANLTKLPLIVLKLTVVMGITWTLGFVLAFYPTPYLEFPFIIINSCQGLLICISFVFKKHVFTLYKQRFIVAPQPEPATTNGAEQQAGR